MKLTDTEREALHESVDIAENCTCCGSDYGWTHVYADVERIVAARLEQQREAIAAAIEVRVTDLKRLGKPRDGFIDAYTIAARIVREYHRG